MNYYPDLLYDKYPKAFGRCENLLYTNEEDKYDEWCRSHNLPTIREFLMGERLLPNVKDYNKIRFYGYDTDYAHPFYSFGDKKQPQYPDRFYELEGDDLFEYYFERVNKRLFLKKWDKMPTSLEGQIEFVQDGECDGILFGTYGLNTNFTGFTNFKFFTILQCGINFYYRNVICNPIQFPVDENTIISFNETFNKDWINLKKPTKAIKRG